MTGLHRHLAPLSDAAWARLETEARETLSTHLAARRFVDFDGPLGWDHSSIDLGRVEVLEGDPAGAEALVRRRVVRPLIELRIPFGLSRDELDRIDRGAASVDLEPLHEAARRFAKAEDDALFEGYADADIPGILTDATTEGVAMPDEVSALPDAISEALAQLHHAGVAGPYAVALGPETYSALQRTTGVGGYPVLSHVRNLIDAPVVWAPSLRGGMVASLRGGDFKLVCGRDAAIGYASHDDEMIRLYLEESFAAELTGAEAAVPLLAADARS